MAVRRPSVAGQFYPLDPAQLRSSIEGCFLHVLGPGRRPPADRPASRIFGLVSPHAGYMYSGPVAAHGYYAVSPLTDVDLVIMVGPNHWGIGSGVAAFKGGSWSTPLGEVGVDEEATRELVRASGIVDFDETAHEREHSLEVQVPFLQYIYSHRYAILPVSMALQDRTTALEVGEALAKVAEKRRAILIASSDLTHYENNEEAYKKDSQLIKAILQLDFSKYYSVLEGLRISACGYGAIAAIMTAVKRLGAKEGKLLKYSTSGDVVGDLSLVVGYTSVLFA